MNKIRLSILSAAAVLPAASVLLSSATTEQVVNGNFAAGTAGWTNGGVHTQFQVTNEVAVVGNDYTGYGNSYYGIDQCITGIEGGSEYQLTAEAFVASDQPAEGMAGIYLHFKPGDNCDGSPNMSGGHVSGGRDAIQRDVWFPLGKTVTAPPTAKSLYMRVIAVKEPLPANYQNGVPETLTAKFDNISFSKVEQPQDPPVDDPQDPPVDDPQDPPADDPQAPPVDDPQDPPADDPKDPPADDPQDPPADDPQDPPADDPQDPPADDPKGPPAGDPKGPPADDPQAPPADDPQDSPPAEPQGEPQGPGPSAPQTGNNTGPTEPEKPAEPEQQVPAAGTEPEGDQSESEGETVEPGAPLPPATGNTAFAKESNNGGRLAAVVGAALAALATTGWGFARKR